MNGLHDVDGGDGRGTPGRAPHKKVMGMHGFDDLDGRTASKLMARARALNRISLSAVTKETLPERYRDSVRLMENIRRAIGGDLELCGKYFGRMLPVSLDDYETRCPVYDGTWLFVSCNWREIEEYEGEHTPRDGEEIDWRAIEEHEVKCLAGDDATRKEYKKLLPAGEYRICREMYRRYHQNCINRLFVMWAHFALVCECEKMEGMADEGVEQRDGSWADRPGTCSHPGTPEGEARRTEPGRGMDAEPDGGGGDTQECGELLPYFFKGNTELYGEYIRRVNDLRAKEKRCETRVCDLFNSMVKEFKGRIHYEKNKQDKTRLYWALKKDRNVHLGLTLNSFRKHYAAKNEG